MSLSSADATSLNPNQIAGTNINFSGSLDAGEQTQRNDPYMPSTAISSASQRDSSASLGEIGGPANSEGIPQKWLIIGGVAAVLGLGVTIYFFNKRK